MQSALKPQLVDVPPEYRRLGRRVVIVCSMYVLKILSHQSVKQDLRKVLQRTYHGAQKQCQYQCDQRCHKEVADIERLRPKAQLLHVHAKK